MGLWWGYSDTSTAPSSSLLEIVWSTTFFANSYTLPVTVPDPTGFVVSGSLWPSPVTVVSLHSAPVSFGGATESETLSVPYKADSEGWNSRQGALVHPYGQERDSTSGKVDLSTSPAVGRLTAKDIVSIEGSFISQATVLFEGTSF